MNLKPISKWWLRSLIWWNGYCPDHVLIRDEDSFHLRKLFVKICKKCGAIEADEIILSGKMELMKISQLKEKLDQL